MEVLDSGPLDCQFRDVFGFRGRRFGVERIEGFGVCSKGSIGNLQPEIKWGMCRDGCRASDMYYNLNSSKQAISGMRLGSSIGIINAHAWRYKRCKTWAYAGLLRDYQAE